MRIPLAVQCIGTKFHAFDLFSIHQFIVGILGSIESWYLLLCSFHISHSSLYRSGNKVEK